MAEPRRTSPWIAFAAGAVAMLAIALLVFTWMQRRSAAEVAKAAVNATAVVPDLDLPSMPDAPRIPDAPMPRPR